MFISYHNQFQLCLSLPARLYPVWKNVFPALANISHEVVKANRDGVDKESREKFNAGKLLLQLLNPREQHKHALEPTDTQLKKKIWNVTPYRNKCLLTTILRKHNAITGKHWEWLTHTLTRFCCFFFLTHRFGKRSRIRSFRVSQTITLDRRRIYVRKSWVKSKATCNEFFFFSLSLLYPLWERQGRQKT